MELNDDDDHHYNFNLQQSLWGCNKVNDIIGDIIVSVNNNLRRSQSVGFKLSLILKMLSCHVQVPCCDVTVKYCYGMSKSWGEGRWCQMIMICCSISRFKWDRINAFLHDFVMTFHNFSLSKRLLSMTMIVRKIVGTEARFAGHFVVNSKIDSPDPR